jgi:endonuclease/exonuclease/phosphatase family metal-dependent hydrolase
MRFVTWNCQGAFRKKYPLIASLSPDLAVIQECESPERLKWKEGNPPTCTLWFGEKPTKGLGIFSWTDLEISSLGDYDASIRYCVPLEIQRPIPFRLVAVWAMDHRDRKLSYSAQVFSAVGLYREFISGGDTLFMGDFNSSKRSTPKSRLGNHTTLTTQLDDLWMVSAYHHFFHEKQAKETRGTYFRGRKSDKPAHIDYAYVPVRWLRRLRDVQVGDPAFWLAHSDHCPLIVDFITKEKDSMV